MAFLFTKFEHLRSNGNEKGRI